MNEKTKKGSPHKDPEKKRGSLMIASVGRLLKEDDVKGKPHARTRSEKIKDMFKNVELGAGAKSAISRLLKNVKGIPSDQDVKMLIKNLPTNKDGGMVKKYRGGGSVHNNKKQYGTQCYRAARKPK